MSPCKEQVTTIILDTWDKPKETGVQVPPP